MTTTRCSPRCGPGARGYLLKGAGTAEVVGAVRATPACPAGLRGAVLDHPLWTLGLPTTLGVL
jgi:hypothetical protein